MRRGRWYSNNTVGCRLVERFYFSFLTLQLSSIDTHKCTLQYGRVSAELKSACLCSINRDEHTHPDGGCQQWWCSSYTPSSGAEWQSSITFIWCHTDQVLSTRPSLVTVVNLYRLFFFLIPTQLQLHTNCVVWTEALRWVMALYDDKDYLMLLEETNDNLLFFSRAVSVLLLLHFSNQWGQTIHSGCRAASAVAHIRSL